MKISYIPSAFLLLVLLTDALAQSSVIFKIVDQSPTEALEVYRRMTGFDLVVAPNVETARGRITIQSEGDTSADDAARLIERALREQAGVILSRRVDGRVSVTSKELGDGPGVFPPTMKWGTLVLTRDIVRSDSVRVFGPDKGANLSFAFANKNQQEIEKIMRESLGKKIRIQEGETRRAVGGGGGGLTDGTNTVGLVLIFETKAEAKQAASILRGQKDE